MLYMFCYDISDPKRLRRTAKMLEKYGLRVQKSFFQCDIEVETADKIYEEAKRILEKDEDSFVLYPLCDKCSKKYWQDGERTLITLEGFQIL